jgi:hypothetical protein
MCREDIGVICCDGCGEAAMRHSRGRGELQESVARLIVLLTRGRQHTAFANAPKRFPKRVLVESTPERM